MSSGTQVDLDWSGVDSPSHNSGSGGVAAPAVIAPNTGSAYLSDEEILGIDPPSPNGGYGGLRPLGNGNNARNGARRDAAPEAAQTALVGEAEIAQAGAPADGAMPEWMRAVAADPQNAGQAQQLWREHQEFRAAFSSPEEARAIKELLPGGVKDVLTLRDATQSVDRIDAAIFSGDARAQSEVVAELARANPAAFRAMFAEAAKVLAGMGGAEVAARRLEVGNSNDSAASGLRATRATGREPLATVPESTVMSQQAPQSAHFDPTAYAAFERSTNDAVARDVRGSISDTLARVMPEGVADGAARRIGEDIFNEVHRALAADPNLSAQVAGVLRDRRFGGVEQQRVAALLAGRAKQLVPSVARRVIGEWTSSVLNTARSKAARQEAAASRVDIAAPGGSLDSMPLRQMSAREVNYASMSDEEILGM